MKLIIRLLIFFGTAGFLGSLFFFVGTVGDSSASLVLWGLVLALFLLVFWRFSGGIASRCAPKERVLLLGNRSDADMLRRVLDSHDCPFRLAGFLSVASRAELADPLPRAGTARSTSSANLADATIFGCTAETNATGRSVEGLEEVPPLQRATADRLREAVVWNSVKSVVVRDDAIPTQLTAVLAQLRFQGIRIYSLPDFYMKFSEELPLELLGDTWLSFAQGFDLLSSRMLRRIKRIMDFLVASLGLLLSFPILVLAAIAIKVESRGPVIFRQWRVGQMERPFPVLKLRTMGVDAERDGKAQWAARDDPRVTRVGRVLRKLRLDEIPQMINVLRGEMSFVGPRPERREFVDQLASSIPYYDLRHIVRPGLSGWAQVNFPYGASIEDARRKLQFDLYYIRNASPLLDLKVLFRTARVVLLCQGSR